MIVFSHEAVQTDLTRSIGIDISREFIRIVDKGDEEIIIIQSRIAFKCRVQFSFGTIHGKLNRVLGISRNVDSCIVADMTIMVFRQAIESISNVGIGIRAYNFLIGVAIMPVPFFLLLLFARNEKDA